MDDIAGTISETVEKAKESRLNSWIAFTVAVTATFMAICNIKAGNVVQTMAQAQADANNQWAYFQAKSMKQQLAENARDQVHLQLLSQTRRPANYDADLQKLLKDNEAKIARYENEKSEIKSNAEKAQEEYQALGIRDDQFDMAEALFSLSIAIFGVSALTQNFRLFFLGAGFSCVGFLLGISGFVGWAFHPQWLASLLG